ncbi:CoA transferase [Actinomadura sp. NBRC 104412]|uniref:CaiB/BaiF CoA transferase family protein n=1 Tax=Actinomadura sp. NBRC 104412 TaxID=3032203 RepID=UPI0024A1D4F2|nr:CoA transferase [Actinomadura sp. NBRC 104412]GLZ08141.1 CoA transferase [Actinomadura sp. NBRC 104412]
MTLSTGGGPLAGVRVIDFSIMIAGPYCTRLLADMGAEVIKIEPPEGDPMRSRAPLRDGYSAYFGHLNTGKRSVRLDLRTEPGLRAAHDLVAAADVVVENFRPGVMARYGLDEKSCRARDPRLVYCSVSGYGQSGPSAELPAFAQIVHAMSGYDMANFRYQKDAVGPASCGIFIADILGAALAYGAVVTGLVARERTGLGEGLDVSLLEAMLSMLVFEIQAAQVADRPKKTVYRPVRAKDGFLMISPVTERNFRALAAGMDRPGLLTDARFAHIADRERNWDELYDEIEGWAAHRTADQVEERMSAAGVPCGRYREVAEVFEDPQTVSRGTLRKIRDGAGEYLATAPPFMVASRPRAAMPDTVAELGADTAFVLREVAGYGEAEISAVS